jgi:ABC-2 type transport system ATP-binding protein
VVSGRVVSFALDSIPGGLHDALAALPGVTEVESRAERISVQTADSDATLRAVLARYPAAHDIEVLSRTMDDAFLALTHSPELEGAVR